MDEKPGFWARLRGYFLAGIAITVPLGLTLYCTVLVVKGLDKILHKFLPAAWDPGTYWSFDVPGLGLIALLMGLTLIGWITTGFFGRVWLWITESILNRMPVVRSLYRALKQITDAVFGHKSDAFRKVVLIEYPRKGIWSLGFLSGQTRGEVQTKLDQNLLNVFVPTSPNPTSGFFLFVPESDVQILDMSVEEGFKMVMSAGLISAEPKDAS